jgi:hypothetical protein
LWKETRQVYHGTHDVRLKCIERRSVCLQARSNDDIDRRCRRKNTRTHQLAQASLQSVAINGRSGVSRNDDSNPWIPARGRDYPNVEMRGSDSFPLSRDTLELHTACEPTAPRKAEPLPRLLVRRRRTYSGSEQSAASALSSGGD